MGMADVWDKRYPAWFRMLRFVLTTGAVASMMAVLWCFRTMDQKSIKVCLRKARRLGSCLPVLP